VVEQSKGDSIVTGAARGMGRCIAEAQSSGMTGQVLLIEVGMTLQ
jgi:hypothetical protein